MNRPDTIAYLEAAMRALGQHGRAIATNVANLDTPGYRRLEVQFRQALAEAMRSGRPEDLARFRPELVRPMTTPVDGRGNDVNLDMEVGEMVRNGAMYKTYMRLMAKLYRQMEMAMEGQ